MSAFTGETMVCALCSKVKQSDPNVESQWRAIEINGERFYVCTKHFPSDRASAQEFSKAYRHVLISLMNRKSRGKI